MPLAAVLLVVVCGAVVLVTQLGALVVDRGRARNAADATALVAATDGSWAAADAATRNGGHLLEVVQVGTEVEVTVQVGRARATSRARAVP